MTEAATIHDKTDTALLVSDIVVAYVSNNTVAREELPALIAEVHSAIDRLRSGAGAQPEAKPVPAVPVKKSVTPDYIICLEDGKPFKSLKRHLATHHGLTPDEYRQKWGLPRDYPMVAPAYAAARSTLARTMGLGRKRAEETSVPATEEKPKRPRAPRKAAAAAKTVGETAKKPARRKKTAA